MLHVEETVGSHEDLLAGVLEVQSEADVTLVEYHDVVEGCTAVPVLALEYRVLASQKVADAPLDVRDHRPAAALGVDVFQRPLECLQYMTDGQCGGVHDFSNLLVERLSELD